MADDKQLERVRALLAMAEDPAASPHERENFSAKAAELLAKYAITDAMLTANGSKDDRVEVTIITIVQPYELDKGVLLGVCAKFMGGQAIRSTGGRYTVVGYRSDLDRIELIFTSLLVQQAFGLNTRSPRKGESTTSYRKAWLSGFTYAIGERLEAAQKYAQQQANDDNPTAGTDLVLVTREARIAQEIAILFPELGKPVKRKMRGSGFWHGKDHGDQADIGTSKVSPRQAEEIQ